MKIRFAQLLLLLMAVAIPGAMAAEDDAAREEGRAIVATLLGGEAGSLWERIGGPLRGLIGGADALEGMMVQIQARFGDERSLLDEHIEIQGGGFHYRRVARHEGDPTPLAIDLHVDGAGLIQGLRLGPAPSADAGPAPAVEPGRLPGEARLQGLVDAFVASGGAPGVVLAVRDSAGMRVVAAGDAGDGRAPDAETVFEAGSVTKGLTGLLLARMIADGAVRADQPIGELFPEDVELATHLAAITLADLATHRSGLPPLPPGLLQRAALSPHDPYAGTTVADLFDEVAGLEAGVADARGRFAYSNLGTALLGQLLARAAGQPYEALLAERVFTPLGLARPVLSANRAGSRVARGHDRGEVVPTWTLDAYAPAGAWRASAEEMMALADRLLVGEPSWVAEALRERTGDAHGRSGLGWFHATAGSRAIVWHNGGTGGFRSFMAVVPDEALAVVVLANGTTSVDELALTVLDPGR